MTPRSFFEFVKDHLDNKLYNVLNQYIEGTDPSALDLRLKKVRNIGEVKLDDTELKFADVSDLPGTEIKFDVVVNASLIVYDNDIYHNDEYDYVHQWFVIPCRGDLENHLQDIETGAIYVYEGHNKRNHPMTNTLVPIIKTENLDAIAEEFLKKYYPDALQQPMWVNPDELAKRMNLTVLKHSISEDDSVFGQIFFRETDTELYDNFTGSNVTQHVFPGTIIVDPDVAFQRNLGAYNNTIVHECVHWEYHKKAFALEELYNADASNIKCKVIGGIAGQSDKDTQWMEWQANKLAPRIQMPLEMFKKKAEDLIFEYRRINQEYDLIDIIEPIIDELATFFCVSRASAKIRMIEAGYGVARGAFNYVDGHYVKPHKTSTREMKDNETFSVPIVDATVETSVNPRLKELVDSGTYLYVDSHFVVNLPRYVERCSDGSLELTHYARNHMEECCAIFQLSIQSDIEKEYHTECFLNRDKANQVKFRADYEDNDASKDHAKELNAYNNDIINLAKKLPASFSGMLDTLITEEKMTEETLAENTELDVKTIQRLRHDEPNNVTIETVIQLCIGLSLPPALSDLLLKAAGKSLMMTPLHMAYRFLLGTCYDMTISECDQILHDLKLPLLGKESKKKFIE